ncbi:MAG: ribonuclease III [Clostridiales bacterium]|nr:ribonuclease III [Clostridiales bacterium]
MENSNNQYNSLSLAFLGDAVYSLMVRDYLLESVHPHASKLHALSIRLVNAASQAKAAKKILPLLDEEESDILRRGRNAHTGHTPKNQTEEDYHYATGLEALFGYLYLNKREKRMAELFKLITEDFEISGEDKCR